MSIRVALAACLLASSLAPGADAAGEQVLVFSKTAGFRHGSIPNGIAAIRKMAEANDFAVVATEDSAIFNAEALAGFDAVVFLNTTGDVLDDEQQKAFEAYIRGGGGYVGVHSAADTEYDWPFYGKVVGAYFKGHPHIQKATVQVTDRKHPSTKMLPERWERTDEWYTYRESPRGKVHVLCCLDETTYEGGNMNNDHPIAWCHLVEGGRAWYTGGGHTNESYEEPLFVEHILNGILWAAGRIEGDAGASVDRHWEKVVLDDFTTDPMELAVAEDGRVVFVERSGIVKVWKPDARRTVTAGFVDVFDGLEDGLLGVALDPGFMDNGWIYLYYAPSAAKPVNVLSRFTLVGDRLETTSEIVMLEVATQRDECCHSGGSITFDSEGNLYLSTGDNTSPFASDGYSPIDEREGRSPFDAQKSSANTQDLRGKILRITPQADGSYTIPEGNLFADAGVGRPEIYVMGCRNPFRIAVDPDTGWLYWGEVGPDAGAPRPGRGPAGHDEFNRAKAAGNFGWPYFVGHNLAYHDYDFATGQEGDAFDVSRPINASVNNTGSRELPPAQPSWIGYTYAPTPAFPEIGAGGRCAMGGPVYRAHRIDERRASPHRVPEHYDGAVFIYEWARNWIQAVHLDEDGDILAIEPFLRSFPFIRPHELELGPDGCLYAIEWGTGFGGGNPDARVVRLEYHATGGRPPLARASVDSASGPAPLSVRFSADASQSRAEPPGLRFAWDFDGDGSADAEGKEATHVYTGAGNYAAQLVVTDADGLTGVDNIAITAGNTAPEVAIEWPPHGAVLGFGETTEFRVRISDPEDDDIDERLVTVQPFLGHDTHAHPLLQLDGFRGTFSSIRDEGHGAGADLFTVLTASYTDRGAPGVAPLMGRDEIILQPRRKQAEHATYDAGVRIAKADDPEDGGQAIIFGADEGTVAYAPVNLHGVKAIAVRVAGGPRGGTLELRSGSADGTLLGAVTLEPTGVVELDAGRHALRVEYFERSGGAGLIMRMSGGGLLNEPAPVEMLFNEDGGPGLRADYYVIPPLDALPHFDTLEPYSFDTVETIDFPSTNDAFLTSGRPEDVAVVFTGFLEIAEAGPYSFSLESDDGSRLLLDGVELVTNDGLHGMREQSAPVRWETIRVPIADPGGTHDLVLVWRTGGGASEARLNWLEFEGGI